MEIKQKNLGIKFNETNDTEIIDGLECRIITFNLAEVDTGVFARANFTKREISPNETVYNCDYIAMYGRNFWKKYENPEQLKKSFEDFVLKDVTRKIYNKGALRKVEINAEFHEEKYRGYISIPENEGKAVYFPLGSAKETFKWK